MSKKIAVYSGTFDPITLGHLDIVTRAATMFDERINLTKAACKNSTNVVVVPFDGLLVDFCKAQIASIIVRGIRNSTDLDYETQMAAMNKKMLPSVESVFLLPTSNVQCISSTLVREISKLGGDVSEMVSPTVLTALGQK